MKNIHILPTDKPSRLYLFEERLILGDLVTVVFKNSGAVNQHIYITSDEEINKDTKTCWCIDISCNELVLHQGVLPSYHYKHYKKIIMTTDKSINVLCSCGKDCGAKESGVQAIDDEFLEWFVKNPTCEEVEVEREKAVGYAEDRQRTFYGKYKIIIPKEEPKQNLPYWFETQEWEQFSKLAHNNFGGKPSMKTELEEAAENYGNSIGNKNGTAQFDFIRGAKWQQEQILQFLYSEIIERRPYSSSKMCEEVIKFIEQFKKK